MSTTRPVSWGIAALFAVTLRPPFFPFPDEGSLGDGHLLALANRAIWLALVLPVAFITHRVLMRKFGNHRFMPNPTWLAVWTGLVGTTLVEFVWPNRPATADLHFSAGAYLMALFFSFALFGCGRLLAPLARKQFVLLPHH